MIKKIISVPSHALDPSTCHKLSHILGPLSPRAWRTLWTAPNKPIRHVVCAGALGRIKPIRRVMQLKLHCACAHDMTIRPIQVQVTLYLGQNLYRKPRCWIGLLWAYFECRESCVEVDALWPKLISTGYNLRLRTVGHKGVSSLESTSAISSSAFCTETCSWVVDGALVGSVARGGSWRMLLRGWTI